MDLIKRKKIFNTASLCRNFETNVLKYTKEKKIKFPVYVSAGQEFISSTLSVIIKNDLKIKPLIFAQHRSHSTYISFGGDLKELINELLGLKSGCAYGMGGSASIQFYIKKTNNYLFR